MPARQKLFIGTGTGPAVVALFTILSSNAAAQYWSPIDGTLTQISLASDGTMVGVNAQSQIYRWSGSAWTQLSGALAWVSAGSTSQMWGVNAAGSIWRGTGSAWTQVPAPTGVAGFIQVSTGNDGTVMAITNTNDIYRYNTANSTWTQIPGKLQEVAVGSASVIYGVNSAGAIYRFSAPSSWAQLPGTLKHITASSDGEVWGTTSDGYTYRWNGSAWDKKQGKLALVAVGNSNSLAGITQASQIVTGRTQPEFCWKASTTRGVGTIPANCSLDQQKQGLLCYPACKAGYTGFVASCFQNCPSDYRDDGGFCAKPAAYGRGAGYPWQFGDALNNDGMLARCRAATGGACEMWGAVAYPVCKAGYQTAGANICTPVCPTGMTDIGVSCTKQSYTRATILPQCDAGQVYDAGLCYPPCPGNYKGVGPVCWGACGGATPFECAAGCAKDQTSCASHTSDMVLSTVESVIDLASFALPGVGGIASAAVKEGLKEVAIAAGKFALASGGTYLSKQGVKLSIQTSSSLAGVPISDTASNNWADMLTTMQQAGAGDTSKVSDFINSMPFDPSVLDITGFSGIMKAYTNPICK